MSEELLHRDIFPAEVLLPDGTLHRKVRAFVTDRRLVVWRLNEKREIEPLEFYLNGDPPQRNRATLHIGNRLQIELASGTAYINRAQGCGCGSPLKRVRSPYSW